MGTTGLSDELDVYKYIFFSQMKKLQQSFYVYECFLFLF